MSERMTDERLAEIERAVFDVEGWPVNCSEELLQALKADRAEVVRLWNRLNAAEMHLAGLIFCEGLPDATIGEIRKAGFDLQQRAEAAESALIDCNRVANVWADKAQAAEAKLRGANAEIERQKGLVRNYLETIEGNEIDIAGLLEKLRAVGELPNKWRKAYSIIRCHPDTGIAGIKQENLKGSDCAAELEALLKTNDEPRTRPIQGGYLEKDTTTGEVHEPTTERDWTSDAWSK